MKSARSELTYFYQVYETLLLRVAYCRILIILEGLLRLWTKAAIRVVPACSGSTR